MPQDESGWAAFGGRAAQRLALGLALSAALHLALIYGIRVEPARPGRPAPALIQARLEAVPAASGESVRLQAERPAPAAESAKPPKEAREGPPEEPQARPAPGHFSRFPALDVPLPDPTYYPASQLDVHAVPLQPINPQYPPDASGIPGGEVTLLLLIDEFGKVRELSVLDANPPGYFEQSAIDAFRDARFVPAMKDGRQVKSRMVVRVSYGTPPPTIAAPPR